MTTTRPEHPPRCPWPAEWTPHAATWLAWPHCRETWPGRYGPVPAAFARLALTIAEFEPVAILAAGPAGEAAAAAAAGHQNVALHPIPTNDAWIRDYGPIFVQEPDGQAVVDWRFNAWGGKYPPWQDDDAATARIAARIGRPLRTSSLVVEGGAIEGNGRGLLLTTAGCLDSLSRNPGRTRQEIDRELADKLGVTRVAWLPNGELPGDDTDGHIDQLARFVDEATVVAATCDDARDPAAAPLARNLALLRQIRDQDGRPLQVVPLPTPRPRWCFGRRLPCSYCNFCFVNGGLIVPTFDDPADDRALGTLRELLPQRRVVGLPALDLIWGLGAFHCLSQQQPAATPDPR